MTNLTTKQIASTLVVLIALHVSSAVMAETVVEVGSTYVDAGALAVDNYDGDLSASVAATNNVNTKVLGTYTVTYNVKDSSGNAADAVVRTVRVVDTTAPVVTLNGSASVSINVGSTYSDAGATAVDNYDGNLTSSIVTTGLPIDTTKAGEYVVSYSVTDKSGNVSVAKTRTVKVVSTKTGELTITSPAAGSTLFVSSELTSMSLVLTAKSAVAVDYVEYTVDGVPFGMGGDANFTAVTALDLTTFADGEHTVVATARKTSTQETITDSVVFTVASITSNEDADANALPDNPFATLAVNDMWVDAVSVSATGGYRMVGAFRFDSSVTAPVTMMLENATASSRTVKVTVPRGLVAKNQSAVVMVAFADTLDTLYGTTNSSTVKPEPTGYALVAGGQYVQVDVLTTADNGNTFVELDAALLAANPIHVELAGLTSTKSRSLMAHPAFVTFDDAGMQLFGETGNWTTDGLTKVVNSASSMTVDLTSLVAFAPYEAQALTITTASLPSGKLYTAYSQKLDANGGAGSYKWTKVSGSLPNGLTLSTNGTVSGKPMTRGTFTFTARVADANNQTLTQSFTIVIKGLTW